ncbi:MAG: hypothetical protein ACR2OD_01490 [Gaiellaceae bacterium]
MLAVDNCARRRAAQTEPLAHESGKKRRSVLRSDYGTRLVSDTSSHESVEVNARTGLEILTDESDVAAFLAESCQRNAVALLRTEEDDVSHRGAAI